MAVDDLEREYHLTPNGWVKGTSFCFGNTDKEITPPPDRVLTIVERTYQSSRRSQEEISSRVTWRSPMVSAEQIVELTKTSHLHFTE